MVRIIKKKKRLGFFILLNKHFLCYSFYHLNWLDFIPKFKQYSRNKTHISTMSVHTKRRLLI